MEGLNEQSGRSRFRSDAAAIVSAAAPSAVLIGGVIELPAGLESQVTLPGLLLSLAAATALTFWIRRSAGGRFILSAVILAALVAGVTAGAVYWNFERDHVVSIEENGQVKRYVLPSDPSEEARQIAARSGGDYAEALQSGPERERLRQLLEQSGSGTLVAMAALLVACQIFLGAGLTAGNLALAMGSEPTTPANEDEDPPSRGGGGSTRSERPVPERRADGF